MATSERVGVYLLGVCVQVSIIGLTDSSIFDLITALLLVNIVGNAIGRLLSISLPNV